ncbi:MAG TPA: PP2C family protein-serine/threonine phosphatase [Actinomycetes bacterium]|nr:PP2C family protein-serine/threonine phosphatase [Actinomycetes bacterium]
MAARRGRRHPGGGPGARGRLRGRGRRAWLRLRRGFFRSDGFGLLLLGVAAVVLSILARHWPRWFSPAALVLLVVIGGLVLSVRAFLLLVAVILLALVWAVRIGQSVQVRPGIFLVVGLTGLVMLYVARSRARLGVQAIRGDSMLVDLRDRVRLAGALPPLPSGWDAEVVLRPAGGASFSGDFVVATRSADERTLELVVCDVSGKGVEAGTRSLLLSGAMGGLLGGLPAEEFLPAANAYLLRQGWGDGFATAVHVAVDLESGAYVLGSAGHPPAAHFQAGSGRWRLTEAQGTALGIDPDATYVHERGTLGPGDALLLYTDGLVETPGADIEVGIDRLLGQAEHLVPRGFRRGARRLLDSVSVGHDDDRAIVLLWRS